MVLTVIIRSPRPMVIFGDGPSYRSVRVPLTDEQVAMLTLNKAAEPDYYEEIDRCFIEPVEPVGGRV